MSGLEPTVAAAAVYVPDAEDPPPPAEIGGKGHHLARLARLAREPAAGFTVPRFVVVRASVFDSLVAGALPWPRDETEAAARATATRGLELPQALRAEVRSALSRAGGLDRGRLAVRSSAAAEDGASRSFAGQFDTILGVRVGADDPSALWDAIRRVWASAFNAHAAAYGAGAARMAVVIQEMVDPAAAGVAFSQDPVSGEAEVAVVSAVPGLGEGLVSGELDADTFRVRGAGAMSAAVTATIAAKTHAVRLAAGGETELVPLADSQRRAPSISEDEARAVAACARRLATAFGRPQDVEWALLGERPGERRLIVLQTRPITALGGTARTPAVTPATESGERRVWDNSNIIESYGGVTTPLTFSFARAVYEDVYRQFCRLMGTSERLLESHAQVFANMLGLVRGRVYYNLLNWYRTLALLPGFTWNRGFMEGMMGVRETLEDPPAPAGTGSRLRDFLSLARMVARMTIEAGKLAREVPAFLARVEAALGPLAHADVERWPAEKALALYRRLEDELLAHWRAPLVNDFFAMIFFGTLRKLTEKWIPTAPPTLVNDLLCGEGGIVSTEPARRVMALAQRVPATPAVRAAFESEPDDAALLARLEREPAAAAFVAGVHEYLERFGDRCMEELKLETVTLREDPRFLIAMVRAYVAGGTIDPAAAWDRERAIRRAAEDTVTGRLRGWRLPVFRWVLARARLRVRDRENLRFERTRVFGMVRRIFLALGAHLAERGFLDRPRDVFFLTREELFAHFDGTSVTRDLRSLVALRGAEFEGYAREEPPPDRFETLGALGEWDAPAAAPSPEAAAAAGAQTELRGTGCCPGVVRAPVRVVRDPREARDLGGCILVAERTDPGWTLLFPAVKGLLVQRGSLLSHSAIVAREMGLPCVVGIAGLLDAVRDGEEVEMDGTSGVVRRLAPGPA